MKKILLLLASLAPAYGGIDTLAQWDVRTTGADTNGGCFSLGLASAGTDYSASDTPHVTFDGATITGTTSGTSAVITITGYTVAATDVANCLQITGGVNFTAGVYYVASVNTGANTWTMNQNVSSGAGTAMAGAMGGGFATIAKALTYSFGAGSASTDSSNAIWIKNGTYTLTTALLDGTNSGTASAMAYIGYTSTHGDSTTGTNRPLITTATNSTPLLRLVSIRNIRNIRFSNTAGTRSYGIYGLSDPTQLYVYNCKFTGFTYGINANYATSAGNSSIGYLSVYNSEFDTNTTAGIIADWNADITGNTFHNNGTNTTDAGLILLSDRQTSTYTVKNNAFYSNRQCMYINSSNTFRGVTITNNSCTGSTDSGLSLTGITSNWNISANIFYSNGIYGIDGGSTSASYNSSLVSNLSNAFGANGTTALQNFPSDASQITLSASPFTSSTDLTLNNTAGGGALLKGIVGSIPLMTGYTDVGALQSQGTTSSAGANSSYIQ